MDHSLNSLKDVNISFYLRFWLPFPRKPSFDGPIIPPAGAKNNRKFHTAFSLFVKLLALPPILRYTEQNRFGRALLTMFWNFIFYGMIAVGAILFVSLTIYRIDWARHPEKYKDLVEDEDPQKTEYRKKKEADKKAAAQKAKEKEKQLKRQKRVDKLNHYRAINGKGPVGMDGKPIDKKKK